MGEGWYSTSQMMELGYAKRYLMYMYDKPGQMYAMKRNPAQRNSRIYFHLESFKEAEKKNLELQAKNRGRRTIIA